MKRIIIILVVLTLAGCASVSVKYNPATGEISYSRYGDQSIQGFAITKSGDDFSVSFEGQESTSAALADAIKIISALTANEFNP